ncbi:MAG: 5,6-dimethylbenzimidazole synthase [bacterium]
MENHNAFSAAEREAVYRAIRERRDVRRFQSQPLPEDLVDRIVEAALQAPSVGYSQPWNLILISDTAVRTRVREAFSRANQEAQALFQEEKAKQYSALKLEGILDSALNICVTCDRNRFGPVVLGKTCQPDMDLYSAVCAVQNLWLAARAEGVGVGWVSIIHPDDLSTILGLPDGVVPVAYLCVGYTESFAREPELKTAGWLPEIPKPELIFRDQWGQKPGAR